MFKRLMSSATIAVTVTFALFLSMHRLIAVEAHSLPGRDPGGPVAWIEGPNVREAVAVEWIYCALPPVVEPSFFLPSNVPTDFNFGPFSPAAHTEIGKPTISFQSDLLTPSEGPLVRLLTVAPNYPASAIGRDLEGSVTVRFDVTSEGDVINASIVTSTHRVFEASALKAVGKFHFKPRVVDGVALPSQGVTYRFQYRMDD